MIKIVVNHSAEGFAEERLIAESLVKLGSAVQSKRFKDYRLDPSSVCTNLKLQVNGRLITENDVNFSLRRDSLLLDLLDKLFYVRRSEGVAVQSKKYSSSVDFKHVMYDIVHLLIAQRVGVNLQANTVIVVDERFSDSDARVLKRYGVRLAGSGLFDQYVVKVLGHNSISRNEVVNGEVKHKSVRTIIGDMAVVKRGRRVELVNLLRVDSLNGEVLTELEDKLSLFDYLNPRYYVYVASEGVTASAMDSLRAINGYVMARDELLTILSKGSFYEVFKPVVYQPFGLALAALGDAESKIYSTLNDLLYTDEFSGVSEERLIKSVARFLTKKKRKKHL